MLDVVQLVLSVLPALYEQPGGPDAEITRDRLRELGCEP
jgi:hypothetical protein